MTAERSSCCEFNQLSAVYSCGILEKFTCRFLGTVTRRRGPSRAATAQGSSADRSSARPRRDGASPNAFARAKGLGVAPMMYPFRPKRIRPSGTPRRSPVSRKMPSARPERPRWCRFTRRWSAFDGSRFCSNTEIAGSGRCGCPSSLRPSRSCRRRRRHAARGAARRGDDCFSPPHPARAGAAGWIGNDVLSDHGGRNRPSEPPRRKAARSVHGEAGPMDDGPATEPFASTPAARGQTGSTLVYFTWPRAKLDSMDPTPSRRVSLSFRKRS
jgi:hypothetical protein